MVMVDETVVGATFVPSFLIETLRVLRSRAVLPYDVSISTDESAKAVVVSCCEGEAIRPVLRTRELAKLYSIVQRNRRRPFLIFQDMIREHVIEYINKLEENDLIIASCMQQLIDEGQGNFTHVEIDPSTTLYGVSSGLIPWSNFNQGPRVVYFSSMAPQAIGARSLLGETQFDVQTHVLCYPQKQLSRTLTSYVVEGRDQQESFTQMFNVAVMPYEGLNQEDAVVVNKAAVERGLGMSYKITVVRDSENVIGCDKEVIGMFPDNVMITARKTGSRNALESTGLPRVGARVAPGDILVSKVMYTKFHASSGTTNRKVIDRSSIWRGNCAATVASVEVHCRCGLVCVAVKMRELHPLDVGDKLSSTAAQKGVISAIVPEVDLPFNQDGIVPDLVLTKAHQYTKQKQNGYVHI